MQRREKAGHTQYSPIFIGDRTVAMTQFMPEDAIPNNELEMALAEKAEYAALPFFHIRYDTGFTRFHVTPGNMPAAAYLSATKMLNGEGLLELFEYCRNR